jgi:molybdopterin-guanine dinucleotide biosynthesis protein A
VVVQATLIGYVVAGGRSARMGRDKALLPWGGATLLDHAVARLARVCAEVRILCGPRERYADRGLRLVVDASGGGPLAGVSAALAAGADALCLGVDLPNVTVELLAAIAALDPAADAVVPVTARGPEPLCALYRRGCREPVARRLARGDLKMTSFWPDVRVRALEGGALAAFGDAERLFANVNAPEDYRRAAE